MASIKSKPDGVTRRTFLAGAAVAAVAGTAGLKNMAHASVDSKGESMAPVETMNKYGSSKYASFKDISYSYKNAEG